MGNSASYGYRTTAAEIARGVSLEGKTVVVTGANTGIGKETARELAARGAHVIMACRSEDRAREACEDVRRETGKDATKVEYMLLDLTSLQSVRDFADAYKARNLPLHILINNAGIMGLPEYQETKDGVEMQWGVNHVGHHYLFSLLADTLVRSAPSRVVVLSSSAHKMAPAWARVRLPPSRDSYAQWGNYGISKFSNLLFAREVQRRYGAQGVTAYAVHPGVIMTELQRYDWKVKVFLFPGLPFMKSIPQGAATSVYCAIEPGLEQHAGGYFYDSAVQQAREDATEEHSRSLWDITEQLISEKTTGGAVTGEAGAAAGGAVSADAEAKE